jgi:hypothetical protein
MKLQAAKADAITQRQVPVQGGNMSGEPVAFTLGSGSSDMFGMYDENNATMALDDRMYTWTALTDTDKPSANVPDAPYQEETRCKITLPDIEYIKQQRDMDIRGSDAPLPVANTPPATPTRVV